MRPILLITVRLVIATVLGFFIGRLLGDHYDLSRLGDARSQPSAAVHQAACLVGAALGLIVGVLTALPWIRARSRGLALLRGAAAAAVAVWIANRLWGGFFEKPGLAMGAFAMAGALLGWAGSRAVEAPAMRRGAAHETLGSVARRAIKSGAIGLVAGSVLAILVVGSKPRELAGLLYVIMPVAGAILGFLIGVLIPSTARGPQAPSSSSI